MSDARFLLENETLKEVLEQLVRDATSAAIAIPDGEEGRRLEQIHKVRAFQDVTRELQKLARQAESKTD